MVKVHNECALSAHRSFLIEIRQQTFQYFVSLLQNYFILKTKFLLDDAKVVSKFGRFEEVFAAGTDDLRNRLIILCALGEFN